MKSTTDYVPEAEARTISRKPDWICSYCDSMNSAESDICSHCGASRYGKTESCLEYKAKTETSEPARDSENELHLSGEKRYQTNRYNHVSPASHDEEQYGYRKPAPRDISSLLTEKQVLIPALVLILCAIVLLVMIFVPTTYHVRVTDMSWERHIRVESYEWVEYSDWTLPEGAHLLYTNYEYRRTDHVLDHYETRTREVPEQVLDHYETVVTGHRDLGNGYFEEITSQQAVYRTEYRTETYQEPIYVDVPIYDDRYYYEIQEWVFNRSHDSAAHDTRPFWDEPVLADGEREAGRTERYFLSGVTKKGKQKDFELSSKEWRHLHVGDNIEVKPHLFSKDEVVFEKPVIAA